MRKDTRTLNRAEGAEHAQDGSRRGGARDAANPQRTGWAALQRALTRTADWASEAAESRKARHGSESKLTGARATNGRDGAEDAVAVLVRRLRCAVGLAKADANGLTIGHTNVAAKTVEDIVLCADGIGLVDKVDEPALLKDEKKRQTVSVQGSRLR